MRELRSRRYAGCRALSVSATVNKARRIPMSFAASETLRRATVSVWRLGHGFLGDKSPPIHFEWAHFREMRGHCGERSLRGCGSRASYNHMCLQPKVARLSVIDCGERSREHARLVDCRRY